MSQILHDPASSPVMPGRALDVTLVAFHRAGGKVFSADVVLPSEHRPGVLTICPSRSGEPDPIAYAALAGLGVRDVVRSHLSSGHDMLTAEALPALPGWTVQVIVGPTGPHPESAGDEAVAQLVADVDLARAEQEAGSR